MRSNPNEIMRARAAKTIKQVNRRFTIETWLLEKANTVCNLLGVGSNY